MPAGEPSCGEDKRPEDRMSWLLATMQGPTQSQGQGTVVLSQFQPIAI